MKILQYRVPADKVFGPKPTVGLNTACLSVSPSGIISTLGLSSQLFGPTGKSVASIVYVPASTWTVLCKAAHEFTGFVVEPLSRYVPGDGDGGHWITSMSIRSVPAVVAVTVCGAVSGVIVVLIFAVLPAVTVRLSGVVLIPVGVTLLGTSPE